MIEIDGRTFPTVDAVVAWFVDAAITGSGLQPWQTDLGDVLAAQTYTPALAEVAVRVFDGGPAAARAAMCSYLHQRPVEDPPLRDAWIRWVRPPAPWLDERTPGGTLLGSALAGAAEACAIARTQPAVAEAFAALADRYGTWPLWTRALAHGDPRGRGPDALARGIAAGVQLTAGDADMLAWRYGRDAPDRIVEVAHTIAGHPPDARSAFLAEAEKHVDAATRERLRTALPSN